MRLAEETILMLLNEESGYLEQVQGWNTCPACSPAPCSPIWRSKAASTPKILTHHLGDFWSFSGAFSRTRTDSGGDGTAIADVKTRVFRTIAEDIAPDPRDAIIIGLVNACDAFRFLLPAEEYEESKDRIALLGTMDLFTRTIAAAVAESSIRLSSRAAAMTRPIPRVKLLRMIAKKSFRQGSLARLVAELHEEYGSVFTIRPPFVNRGLTVLAGADANTWMNRKGRFHLRTKDLLSDWERVYGASRTLPGMDGAEHYRLRRAQHRGYSRAALEERLDELFDTARGGLRQWKIGDILPARRPARASWAARFPSSPSAWIPRTTSSIWCRTRSGRWSRTCSDRCPSSC